MLENLTALATEVEAWAFLGSPTKPIFALLGWLEAHDLPLSPELSFLSEAAHMGFANVRRAVGGPQ
jgi:hypothetical protein